MDKCNPNVWKYCPEPKQVYDSKHDARSFMQRLGLDETRLEVMATQKKGFFSHLLGGASEFAFQEQYLENHPDITDVCAQGDHCKSEKGDYRFRYKGHWIKLPTFEDLTVEVKCARKIKPLKTKPIYPFRSAVNISHRDKTKILMPDGTTEETNVIFADEYDILAVDFWHAFGQHVFIFARLIDLPKEIDGIEIRSKVIKSNVHVSWPPEHPFTDDFYGLLDQILTEKVLVETMAASIKQEIDREILLELQND